MPNLGLQSNWIWLSDLQSFDRVLVIDWPHPALVHSVSSQFRTVVAVSADLARCRSLAEDARTRAAMNIRVIHASPAQLPLSSESIDCAVLNVVAPPGSRMARARTLAPSAAECARVLAASGWIFATWENWKWHRRLLGGLRPGRGSAAAGAGGRPSVGCSPERILARSGFRDRRPYYLFPSLSTPFEVIPVRRDALLTRTRGRARRALVRLHCHAFLFPDRLLMAKK